MNTGTSRILLFSLLFCGCKLPTTVDGEEQGDAATESQDEADTGSGEADSQSESDDVPTTGETDSSDSSDTDPSDTDSSESNSTETDSETTDGDVPDVEYAEGIEVIDLCVTTGASCALRPDSSIVCWGVPWDLSGEYSGLSEDCGLAITQAGEVVDLDEAGIDCAPRVASGSDRRASGSDRRARGSVRRARGSDRAARRSKWLAGGPTDVARLAIEQREAAKWERGGARTGFAWGRAQRPPSKSGYPRRRGQHSARATLFVGSDEGGKRAAVAYTILTCCKRAGVDPIEYIVDVLPRLQKPISLEQASELLPRKWKLQRRAGDSPPD